MDVCPLRLVCLAPASSATAGCCGGKVRLMSDAGEARGERRSQRGEARRTHIGRLPGIDEENEAANHVLSSLLMGDRCSRSTANSEPFISSLHSPGEILASATSTSRSILRAIFSETLRRARRTSTIRTRALSSPRLIDADSMGIAWAATGPRTRISNTGSSLPQTVSVDLSTGFPWKVPPLLYANVLYANRLPALWATSYEAPIVGWRQHRVKPTCDP
jgi:hypothetical protein